MNSRSPSVEQDMLHTADASEITIEYCATAKGGKILRLNGFDFHKQKQKNRSIHYTCVEVRRGCKARALTDLDGNLKSQGKNPHNHLADSRVRRRLIPKGEQHEGTSNQAKPTRKRAKNAASPVQFEDIEFIQLPTSDQSTLLSPSQRLSELSNESLSSSSCRFCLRKFDQFETPVAINNFVKMQFLLVTDTVLNTSKELPQSICESCFTLIGDHVSFRSQLIQNQKKLVEKLNQAKVEAPKNVKLEIKEEPTEEPSEEVPPLFIADKVYPADENPDITFDAAVKAHEELNRLQQLEGIPRTGPIFKRPRTKTKKGEGDRSCLCMDCGKTYSTEKQMKIHYRRIHLGVKNFQCDHCDYATFLRQDIVAHLRSHFQIKCHFCDQCGKAFVSRNTLRLHLRTHRPEHPFPCPYPRCLKSFEEEEVMRTHLAAHLKIERNRNFANPHPCATCGKAFSDAKGLRRHEVFHQPPSWPCDLCNKSFYRKNEIEAHYKTHRGQRDFKCSICSKAYYIKSHFNRHMATHARKEEMLNVAQ